MRATRCIKDARMIGVSMSRRRHGMDGYMSVLGDREHACGRMGWEKGNGSIIGCRSRAKRSGGSSP